MDPPPAGAEIQVVFPLKTATGGRAFLTGVVCWTGAGMGGGGGFGLELAIVNDGAEGKHWAEWIRQEEALIPGEAE
jgi:hypothetical protein